VNIYFLLYLIYVKNIRLKANLFALYPAAHSKFPFVEYCVHVKLQNVIPRERKCFLTYYTFSKLVFFGVAKSHKFLGITVMLNFFIGDN
jgi:hypothetical protein